MLLLEEKEVTGGNLLLQEPQLFMPVAEEVLLLELSLLVLEAMEAVGQEGMKLVGVLELMDLVEVAEEEEAGLEEKEVLVW